MLSWKTVVGFIVMSVFIVGGLLGFKYYNGEKESELFATALKLGDHVVKQYRGEYSQISAPSDSDFISDSLLKEISTKKYVDKDTFPTEFNISEYYNEWFIVDSSEDEGVSIDAPALDEPLDSNEEVILEEEDLSYLEDDKRLFTKDGDTFINIDDFKFSEGVDYVSFNGIEMIISEEDVPSSYLKFITNPSHLFSYSDSFVDKGVIELLYESAISENTVVVRFKVEKGKLSSMEVSYNEGN